MFDQRRGTWKYTWSGIIGVVVIIIALIQIVRVNPPEKEQAAAESKTIWTDGEVFNGPAEVTAGEFLSFPLKLNRKVTLKAYFTTGKSDKRLECLVIAEKDFNMWKSGSEVPMLLTTGVVPRGTITKVLEPGNYLFILDNRVGTETLKLIETQISVE
jgi:hypothetical protein